VYYLQLSTSISLAYIQNIDAAAFLSIFKRENSRLFVLHRHDCVWVDQTEEVINLYNALFILKAGAISISFDDFIDEYMNFNNLYYLTSKCESIDLAYERLAGGSYNSLAEALLATI